MIFPSVPSADEVCADCARPLPENPAYRYRFIRILKAGCRRTWHPDGWAYWLCPECKVRADQRAHETSGG